MGSDRRNEKEREEEMNKYTNGPWVFRWDIENKIYVMAGPIKIADVGESNRLANGRLIAAAPDLLAALKELVARCDGEEGVGADGSNIQTIAAHAAIKKAEGE